VHAVAQACGVELIDLEYAHAALCAPFATHEPVSGAPGSIGQSGVCNLDQLGIAGRKHRTKITGDRLLGTG
jgi:hypothetical protein